MSIIVVDSSKIYTKVCCDSLCSLLQKQFSLTSTFFNGSSNKIYQSICLSFLLSLKIFSPNSIFPLKISARLSDSFQSLLLFVCLSPSDICLSSLRLSVCLSLAWFESSQKRTLLPSPKTNFGLSLY